METPIHLTHNGIPGELGISWYTDGTPCLTIEHPELGTLTRLTTKAPQGESDASFVYMPGLIHLNQWQENIHSVTALCEAGVIEHDVEFVRNEHGQQIIKAQMTEEFRQLFEELYHEKTKTRHQQVRDASDTGLRPDRRVSIDVPRTLEPVAFLPDHLG